MLIQDENVKKAYYQALIEKDKDYDGIFFAAIKTTGIFCHASCRARKPKYENCDFYDRAEDALLAGFRPCKICQPLSFPQQIPEEVDLLVQAVEDQPAKRWKEADFRELGLNSAAARRKFKEIYGLTFVQYARARRMGLAFHEIQKGSKVIDQQLNTGYRSASGFHDAFSQIMGTPSKKESIKLLTARFLSTPLGRMLAIADQDWLYLLEFDNRRGLEKEIERLRNRFNARIIHGDNPLIQQLERELTAYFEGKSADFSIPLYLAGSDFQRSVWDLLQTIPLGQTASYQDLAILLGDKKKVRAVGNANGANQIAILIPCHRVIQTNGELGGYGGGAERKQYLLELEKKIASNSQSS
ncbi:bifunctional transcriptional activator/DNA repair enzyme AdaA [Streptococcus panodentis]